MKTKTIPVSLTAVFLASTAAVAADLNTYKAPPAVPALAAPANPFAGFYVGVDAGYATSHAPFTFPQGANVAPTTLDPKGGTYGGYFGYNWAFGNVVAGLEADVSGVSGTDTNTFAGGGLTGQNTAKVDLTSTVRARLGYTVLPNLLAYGTGGAAFGRASFTSNVQQAGVGNVLSANENLTGVGWAAGGGLEWAVYGPILLRAEYLRLDFGNVGNSFFSPVSPIASGTAHLTTDVVRGGLAWKF